MTTDYPIRPPSEQLVDLHVYLLPREVWNEKYSSTYNESIREASSAGFVRVWPDLTVCGLRTLIEDELGDSLPQNYVFLRSVGRCMTQIKPRQELELKCKAFLPPTAWAPEIVVLEASRDSMSVPMYQSFPGYSPRPNATQPINGIPTHFPQVANHDRMAPSSDGQSPMVQQQQQQQGYKGDPLGSGRPDAYTNSTNEDSGIAEPTPDDDDDPDYERRKSDTDDPYYNQLHPDQTQNRQFQQTERSWDESDRYQEKEKEEERQRQAEIQQREEERREEEERIEVERQREEERREVERQREEERREHDRKLEQKRQEEVKKQRQREMEERKKEEEKMKEEMKEKEAERQRGIAERERAAAFDSSMPLSEGEEEYNDATIAMETNQAPDGRGHFLNDEQMRRRAEDELEDYEPQSTWRQDGGGETAGHPRHPGSRRNRSREDTEMEMASQQAVQDGLKRVHLTPEVHRKAKIGKIRNSSITDEEDIYETDPEMADLLQQLQVARQERVKKEKERENLIKRAKDLQTKTHERRNRSRDYWKKRYYDEKKKTAPMEEQVSRVRNQLDQMHRKLLSHIEGGKKKGASVKGPPSKKNDHKINILKMQHELEEIKRKVDKSRMKLTSEIKLRNQAEEEVRGLKSEVTQRKINTTLIRNQKLAALKMGDHKLLSKTPIPALGKGPLSLSAKR
ncbi:spermatogenesis-associated protein 1 isoform X2 [Strongylocentrotus purpuratus]|uniref:Spermatogenesis-associated protein 1 C-terminal domain-containing protein n=1 Tax=Strongylocentrotus purpuratus TaxID=7668 RepID=A0A7M7PI98_STRPU|nr:spermatogenesis-associated protein 1 isoform X2 [Strongylocentrotus purpuratus]